MGADDEASRRELGSRELARAAVQIKELEQSLAKAQADAQERDAQVRLLNGRVTSLATALQDKDVQAASLAALEKRVAELHQTMHELEPEFVKDFAAASTGARPDSYASLKAIENMCETVALGRRRAKQQLADAQAKLTAAGARLKLLSVFVAGTICRCASEFVCVFFENLCVTSL